MSCVYCKDSSDFCIGPAERRKSMTAYHFEGVPNSPEDPNKDFYACDLHYKEYQEYWKTMWEMYYSGIM